MNDVYFSLNDLYFANKECAQTAADMKEAIGALAQITERLSVELAELLQTYATKISRIEEKIAAVQEERHRVAAKREHAAAQTKEELKSPSKPDLPENIPPQMRNQVMQAYQKKAGEIDAKNQAIRTQNRKVAECCQQCDRAEEKLDHALSGLHHLMEQAQKEKARLAARIQDSINRAREEMARADRIECKMNAFEYALEQVYQKAGMIAEMQASGVGYDDYITKRFRMANRHLHVRSGRVSFASHASGGYGASGTASEGVGTDPTTEPEDAEEGEESGKIEESEEILMTCCEADAFFASLGSVGRVRIPSDNLPKLGGRRFVAQMEAQGFFVRRQPDGSKIDINGMIHWEKQDV